MNWTDTLIFLAIVALIPLGVALIGMATSTGRGRASLYDDKEACGLCRGDILTSRSGAYRCLGCDAYCPLLVDKVKE